MFWTILVGVAAVASGPLLAWLRGNAARNRILDVARTLLQSGECKTAEEAVAEARFRQARDSDLAVIARDRRELGRVMREAAERRMRERGER